MYVFHIYLQLSALITHINKQNNWENVYNEYNLNNLTGNRFPSNNDMVANVGIK